MRPCHSLSLIAMTMPLPAFAQSATPAAQPESDEIIILGSGLPLPPGTPAYGSTVIDRDRLTNDASGRVEDVLEDVAGFQQFRRSDSRSANPSAQGVTLRALGGNASSRALVLLAVVPIDAETELQARGLIFRDHRTLRFQGADSSSEGEDASIRLIHRGDWQIDALAYIQARNFTNKVISSTSFKLTLDQRNTPSTGLGGKIELRPPVGADHVLRMGVDARLAHGELFEDAYSGVTGHVTTRRNAGGDTSTGRAFLE